MQAGRIFCNFSEKGLASVDEVAKILQLSGSRPQSRLSGAIAGEPFSGPDLIPVPLCVFSMASHSFVYTFPSENPEKVGTSGPQVWPTTAGAPLGWLATIAAPGPEKGQVCTQLGDSIEDGIAAAAAAHQGAAPEGWRPA
jgi:hypothetical protein